MNTDQLPPDAPQKLNVLVIAYYFPPMGLSGVQRTAKFVKYLPEFGWRPIVLTACETPYYAHDESLLEELNPLIESGNLRIVRTKESGAPAKRVVAKDGKLLKLPRAWYQRLRSKLIQVIYQPDSRIKWKKYALAEADKIFAEEHIDAIFTTAPPYTDFLIARELRKKYDVPYLMDYRDAWVANPVLNFYATPFHKAYATKLEDACLRGSSAITVASRRMKEVILARYNFIGHEEVTIVSHGYDSEDMSVAWELADNYRKPEKFRLTYGGAFYVGRSPQAMFEAAKLAISKEPTLKDDLEFVFVGILQKEFLRSAEKMGLASNILATGYLPHRESIAVLFASDVLWMTMSDDISAPGKLYEYFGTGRPILGLVPGRSVAEKQLMDYGAGIAVDPRDVGQISDALLDLYRKWKSGKLQRDVNVAFVRSFDRRDLTKEVARQLRLMLRT